MIRDYAPGDEAAIVALYERSFGQPMGESESSGHWRWEFAQNPVGPRTIKLAWSEELLVGQYAVSPRRLRSLGQDRVGGLSIDSMTHPEFKRRGVFAESGEACTKAMADRGFAFVYGFPNADSIRGFENKLGWKSIMPVPVLAKVLDLGGLAQTLGRPELRRWISLASRSLTRAPGVVGELGARLSATRGGRAVPPVRSFEGFGDWADKLWLRCRDQQRIAVIRDLEFLRWRYDERPESDYLRLRVDGPTGVLGFAVMAFSSGPHGPGAFLMELVIDHDHPDGDLAATALLHACEREARQRSCAFLSAMAAPGSAERPLLLRQAYLPILERLLPWELYFGARCICEVDRSMVLHPESWRLSWGDTDMM
ncbi:GNAT family N-acetyltransferase [Plesiocystis pacifica]|nr:GNAT family N-acetyltransferase [Plesiocystis pacifica]